jgi:hypothetical protein
LSDQRGKVKSRFTWVPIVLVTCAIFGTPTAGAQSNDSTRGYDGQALRFESSWGNVKVIRGADGPVVGNIGWFRSFDVEKLVAASPSARAEARVYKTNNFRGSVVTTVGALAAAIGIVVVANSSNNASSPILIIGGVGAMGWGAQHFHAAYSALSRSLWWYNRDLARQDRPIPTVGRVDQAK